MSLKSNTCGNQRMICPDWPHSSKRTEIPPKVCTIWKARGKNTTTKIQAQMVRSRKRGHQLDGTTVEKAVDTWK